MNPNYAGGRIELPGNLAVLFRPVAMMAPDVMLITEILLLAKGCSQSQSKQLAAKMVNF